LLECTLFLAESGRNNGAFTTAPLSPLLVLSYGLQAAHIFKILKNVFPYWDDKGTNKFHFVNTHQEIFFIFFWR